MLFPVVGQALIERTVLVRSDVLGVPRPDGLGLVELFVLNFDLLDLLLFLWLLLVLVFDFLYLGLFFVILDFFFFVILDLLENDQVSIGVIGWFRLTFSTSLVTTN